jgi:hypothetical protein
MRLFEQANDKHLRMREGGRRPIGFKKRTVVMWGRGWGRGADHLVRSNEARK